VREPESVHESIPLPASGRGRGWGLPQTAIIGGGALGLTLAYRLAQRGERVTVFEREPLPGGLAAGFRVGDVWLEKFYHHLFRSDKAIIALIEELGLGDRLVWPKQRTTTLYGGRVHELSPAKLLTFPPLRPDERLRTIAAMAYLKLMPPLGLEGKRAGPWIRRWMGAGSWRVIWEPVFRSKFGALADEVALPWLWGRIHDRSVALGYLRGGFQQVYNRLEEQVRAHGGNVRLSTGVSGFAHQEGRFVVKTDDGTTLEAERVVSTLPPRVTCRMVPALPEAYRRRHDWGQAYGAHCLILALDRRLTDSYWMNVSDPGYPFMVLVEHTNYLPSADYGGRHLVYLGNYRAMDDPLMSADKGTVLSEFLPALARINPSFREEWVTESWMFAAPWAQPIVTVDYRKHIPPFETPVPGLYQASMFQVYPHDRGQNYSVVLAQELAARL
jgi:protoporphyrinogen oxidase